MKVFANGVGLLGVSIILIMYLLLQCNKLNSTGYTYSIFNMLGSAMILYSLYYEWNLSAAIVEFAWFAISLFGILRRFLNQKKIMATQKGE